MKRLVLVLFMAGCGTDHIDSFTPEYVNDRTNHQVFVEDDLKPYLDDYMQFARANGLGDGDAGLMRRLEWVDKLDGNNVGECRLYWTEGMKNSRWWNIQILRSEYGEYQFKALMMHEFAHCIHGADHTIDRVHIMNPALNHEKVLSEHWDDMLYDLAQYIKTKEWEQ